MQLNKNIITFSGVVLFLIAGMLTMFLLPSESSNSNINPVQQINNDAPENMNENKITENKIIEWYVYVTGAVKNPGVYKVPQNSRIFVAIESAGGFTSKADDTSINMAGNLADGMHIHVAQKNNNKPAVINNDSLVKIPSSSANSNYIQITGNTANTSRNNNNSGLVDINNASESELQRLNGVGSVIAKRIIEYRNTHGRFNSPEDLINVRGIGSAKLEKMRKQILIR